MSQNKNNSDLESNILFDGVNPGILQSFANPKNAIGKKEGSVIYQKGDITEYFYLLIEGSVKLKFTEPDGTNVYISKTENSFFGETELLGKTQRKSSAVADTDCRLYTFTFNELKVLVKKDKQILKNLFSNKTIDSSEEDFIDTTKDLLDTNTDISEITRTTEKLDINQITKEKQNPIPEEEKSQEDEKGVFDNIITKEIFDKDTNIVEQVSEGKDEVIEKTENEQEQDENNLKDSDGFIIEDEEKKGIIEPDIKPDIEESTEQVEPQLDTLPEPNEDVGDVEEEKKTEPDFSEYYETLIKATQNIFSKISLDETAEAIAEASSKLVSAAGGLLYLVDKDTQELRAKILLENTIKDIIIKFSDGLQGTAILENRSIVLDEPKKENNFNPVIEDLTGIKIKNVIYYPIFTINDDPIAVLELYNSEREKFDSREIELLNAISPSIIKALENAHYVDILIQQKKVLSLGEITSFIGEDITSTLRKVKYYSSLLKKKNLSPEVNKLLEIQIGQINSVEDFLKFTDAYAKDKNIIEQSTIKVSEAVTQILNFLAEYVESRNTVIYKKIEEDAVINIDLTAMYLVFYQIAKNACDAMNDKGNIFVTSEKEGKFIKINFRDTGVGISETVKGKIFKPFVTHGKKQKPGLGLAIAEKLVSFHGGYMATESVLGEGSTVSVALPIVF